jgi:atypical dual specificity phosphatase
MRLKPAAPCPPVSLTSWLRARAGFLPSVVWNWLHWITGKRRRWDKIADGLWIGGLPFTRDVPTFREMGIRGVVNTCAEWPGPDTAYEAAGIRHCWVPTVDFTPPSIEALEAVVAFTQQVRDAGFGVYIHCKAGRGRSATALLAYLISQGTTAEAGIQQIAAIRPFINRYVAQREVIKAFAARRAATDQASDQARDDDAATSR